MLDKPPMYAMLKPPKPQTKQWMEQVTPPAGGLIFAAPCGCQFIHDEGDRYWERCGAHR